MSKNRKTHKRVHWPNNTNKPLETSEFINMSNNAVFARKSVPPSKTRHIEEDSDNNVEMNTIIRTPSYTNNLRTNVRNTRRVTKRRRPSNWNNISNNESMSNNNYYDPEENAEIIRKMAALKRNINRNKRR